MDHWTGNGRETPHEVLRENKGGCEEEAMISLLLFERDPTWFIHALNAFSEVPRIFLEEAVQLLQRLEDRSLAPYEPSTWALVE